MKAIIKATDCLTGKSMEMGVHVIDRYDYAQQLYDIVRKKSNRQRIIKELKLYVGDARLELIRDCEILAEGTMTYNAFLSRGNITTKNCTKVA